MGHRYTLGALVLAVLPVAVSCGGPRQASYDELPTLALDDVLEPMRDRPSREKTVFIGDSAWALDYYGRLYVSKNGGSDWTRMLLPDDGHLNTMQVEDGGRLAAVVTDEGILMRTADGGDTWTTIDLAEQVRELVNPDFGGYFDQVSFDASLENGVLIDYCQILRTSDGGKSWTAIADDLQDKGSEERCVTNAVNDATTNVWFAEVDIVGRMLTSGYYLFQSDDNGTNWQEVCSLDEVGLIVSSVKSCFELKGADDAMKTAVVAFTRDMWGDESETMEAFYEAFDRGVFVTNSLAIPEAIRGAYDRAGLVEDATTGRVWTSGGERLAYTDDGGEHWQVVSDGLPDNEYLDFSLGPDRGFAVVHYEYLAVSEDLGKTWQRLNEEPRDIYDFEVLPDHDRVIVMTDRGLSIVDAVTLEWRDVPDMGEASSYVVAGPVIWAFAGDGDVHRSADAGRSWSALGVNFEDEELYFEAASCSAEQCLLEGYQSVARLTADPAGIEVFDLTDELPDPDEHYAVKMILDAELDRGWVAMEDGTVFASNDGGQTWDELADLREELIDFTRSPGTAGFLAWGYSNKYLWSADGKQVESRRLPIDRDASVYGFCWLNDRIALLNAYNDEDDDFHLASTDGGATWSAVESASFDENCRVPGDLVVLDAMIARVRSPALHAE